MISDMVDYVRQAVDLYKELAGLSKLRKASTPFCPEGSLTLADEEAQGQLAGSACRILMKNLWVARLARPDLQKPITDLATHLNCWSVNDDKRLYRLACYMESYLSDRTVPRNSNPMTSCVVSSITSAREYRSRYD